MSDEEKRPHWLRKDARKDPVTGKWIGGATGRGVLPGEVRNPNGRPKRFKLLTMIMNKQMDEKCEFDKKGRTWAEVIVAATMQLAIKGHTGALKEVWERSEGKMKQSFMLEGIEGLETFDDVTRLSKAELLKLKELIGKLSSASSSQTVH